MDLGQGSEGQAADVAAQCAASNVSLTDERFTTAIEAQNSIPVDIESPFKFRLLLHLMYDKLSISQLGRLESVQETSFEIFGLRVHLPRRPSYKEFMHGESNFVQRVEPKSPHIRAGISSA